MCILFDALLIYHTDVTLSSSSSKNIEMDVGHQYRRCSLQWVVDVFHQTAVAFWSVLLGPKYPLMRDVLDFINVNIHFPAGVSTDYLIGKRHVSCC